MDISGCICRWAVADIDLPQATQHHILVVGNLPAAQERHKAAQTAGEHQCVQGQPSSCSMRWARPSVMAAALYRAPLRRLSSVRPQITRSGIRRRISGSWAVPENSTSSPSRTGRRPAQWGSEPVRWKRGRDEWHCPQAGASQRWWQKVRLLRDTASFFHMTFLCCRSAGADAAHFFLIFIGWVSGSLGRCGEGDANDSPLAGLTGEADVAVVILHGVLHDGKAQPVPPEALEWLLSTR